MMKDWKVSLAVLFKDGTIDEDFEATVTARDFEEAYQKAKEIAKDYPAEAEDAYDGEVEEVRIWNIGIISDDIF